MGTCRKGTDITTSEHAPRTDEAPSESTSPDDATTTGAVAPRRRRVVWIIAVALLGAALIATGAYAIYLLTLLDAATSKIEQQEEIIEQKEVFGAAIEDLVGTAAEFDGVLFAQLVPRARIASLVERGWQHRWDASALAHDAQAAARMVADLETTLAEAERLRTAGNASGTAYEATIDTLGGGFVDTLVRDDADSFCGDDVLGCVQSGDPYVVHFDATELGEPYLTDWLQTGVAYHEFAHVLQDTNPAATETALEAFDGDPETMADCFALTYLSGWTLDHRVWTSSYEYWDVTVGYGHVCDEPQRQAVRDWYAALGYRAEPFEQ